METLLLLLLLSYAGSDPTIKENLRSALSFYRENRDLFALLQRETEQKDRPREEVGTLLEKYLGKLG